jgi:hypothetical protein
MGCGPGVSNCIEKTDEDKEWEMYKCAVSWKKKEASV